MRHFTSEGSFYMKDMGQVFSVQMPKDLWEPGHLKDTKAMIDGTPYRIKGVESFAIGRSRTNPYRLKIGLLVEPL
jgi:hypothetical protein